MPKKSVMQCSTTRISKYVKQHPGAQTKEIVAALKINLKTAQTALSRLCIEGKLCKTPRPGSKYYHPSAVPADVVVAAKGDTKFSPDTAKSKVLAYVQSHGGLMVGEIARALNIRPATVSTSLSALVREGRVNQERSEANTKFYPAVELSAHLGFGVSPGMQFLNDRLAEVRA